MIRRFVAIGVPPTVREALEEALEPVRDRLAELRTTDPASWHLTLAFLGEVGDERLDGIVEVVRAALADVAPPATLTLDRAGEFRRSVLWAGVRDEPEGQLARLGGAIQSGCAGAGLPVEQRRVHPHVTIARARRGSSVRPGQVAAVSDAVETVRTAGDARWAPTHVGVWASHLGNGPARYRTEAVVPV